MFAKELSSETESFASPRVTSVNESVAFSALFVLFPQLDKHKAPTATFSYSFNFKLITSSMKIVLV